MDRVCELLQALARWVATREPVPVIYAAPQRQASGNRPVPLLGLVFNDDAGLDGWTLDGRRHAFPNGHLGLLDTGRGSASDEPAGPGPMWITTLDLGEERCFDAPLAALAAGGMPTWPVHRPTELRRVYGAVIAAHRDRSSATRELRLKAAWLELLATAIDELQGGAARPPTATPPSLLRARAHLHGHFAEPGLTLADLAAVACLDVHHFGRQYRRYFGTTPMRELQALRLDQARYLLRTTALRVGEVAAATGFADALYFSRCFRQHSGQSPSQWREGREAPLGGRVGARDAPGGGG